ncbi:MAG: lactate utilization protein [Syntrophales bacterium]|nr:lactate utilization protein [Syntrophales bacterium]
MDTQIEKALSSLQARHINGIFAEDASEANRYILSLIPSDATVGIGDSTSMRQLGTLNVLRERGVRILNPFDPKREDRDIREYRQERERLRKETTLSDVFLTGTNALTQDGRLVNVDAVGNRVAGMFWGHPLSIIIVGRNKIVRDLDEAFHRIRHIIAPNHFKIRASLGGRKRKTPCVATGECNDCRAKDRGCSIFTVIESKPSQTNLNVILVNRDLGLGWDPSWPAERIGAIAANYKKLVSIPV